MFIGKLLPAIARSIRTAEIPDYQQQLLAQQTITNSVVPLRKIHSFKQTKHGFTDAQKLVQSSPIPSEQAQVIPVTAVKVNSISKGLEVILQTGVNSQRLQLTPKTQGNSYIADIPNTQLRLIGGNTFRQSKPAPGITEVTVTNINVNTIRVTVIGEVGVPAVELFDSPERLVIGVTNTTSTAQQSPPPQQKPPTSENQAPIELEVTAPPETGYKVNNTTTATKTPTDLLEIPQSIQVFPRQLIDDLDAQNQGEVLRTAGVITTGFPSTLFDSFSIRGFGSTLFRNGLKDLSGINTVDTANTERIELLRGPASVLYGQLSPGGVINRVTKQPLSEPYYFGQIRVGSEKTVEPSIDISGPLNQDRTLLYRLNYLQDQISLTDNLKFLLGGRFDWLNTGSLDNLSGQRTSQDNNAFSPRLGVVYQPIKPLSLYASYSQSFQQVTGTDAQGKSFVPTRGTQYEVGVKTDLLNHKLSTTLALYDLTQTNLTTVDPNNSRFRIQTGEQRSRGIELHSTGEIAPGWNIIFSYN